MKNRGENHIDPQKQTRVTKAALLISGIAFLFLITSERKVSLCGCIAATVFLAVFLRRSSITPETLKSFLKTEYIVLGILLSSGLGLNFYNRWMFSSRVQVISNILGIGQKMLVLICAAVGALAAAFAVSACLSYYITLGVKDFRGKRETGALTLPKAFLITTIIYILGISAILRANFNYIDDMGRVANGYGNWSDYSRFLSETLSPFIHMDRYLTDVSPLPQLIAVLFLAVAGMLLLYVVHERVSFSVWELIAIVPLGLNPYFLECISYKYDAPYMALSILVAIMPLLYRKKSALTYIFISAVGAIAVCTTYQAATGIYPMLVVLQAFKMWSNGESLKKTGGFCLRSAAGYGLGLAFFYFVIMVPVETYVSSSLTSIGDLLQIIYFNLRRYYTLIREDFKPFWLGLVVIQAIGFIWTAAHSSKRNVFISGIAAMTSLVLMGLVCFGVYPTLSRTLFAPRAMYGFGVLVAIVGAYIMRARRNHLLTVTSFMLSMAFFVFSLTYGNALYVQKEYTDFRIQAVIGDLNDMEVFSSGQPVIVQISGTIGQSPVIANMPQNYNILNRLVPITFQGQWWWGQAGFYQYYGLKNVIRDPTIDLTAYDLPVLEEHMYHTIRGKENYILVELY